MSAVVRRTPFFASGDRPHDRRKEDTPPDQVSVMTDRGDRTPRSFVFVEPLLHVHLHSPNEMCPS
jgi:hypothetical protein